MVLMCIIFHCYSSMDICEGIRLLKYTFLSFCFYQSEKWKCDIMNNLSMILVCYICSVLEPAFLVTLHFTDLLICPVVLDVKNVIYQFLIDKQLCHSNTHNTLIKKPNTEFEAFIKQPQYYIQIRIHSS